MRKREYNGALVLNGNGKKYNAMKQSKSPKNQYENMVLNPFNAPIVRGPSDFY